MKLGSTRQAIHDALCWGYLQRSESSLVEYITYLTRIEKTIRAGAPCGDFLEAAYICAAVNTLSAAGGWLKFAYGSDDSETIQTALAGELRDMFPCKGVRKNQRLLELAKTSLEDFRFGVWREQTLKLGIYAERMGTSEDHFERDWGKTRRAMLKQIGMWDREGVGQVSRMVRALRGPTDVEDRPSEVLRDLKNPLQNGGYHDHN